MATRKGDDDVRRAGRGRRKDGQPHPSSYVEVVGTPRRRKSSAAHAPVSQVPAADMPPAVEHVSVSAAGKYQVERASESPGTPERTFSAPKRSAHGPLGMEGGRDVTAQNARAAGNKTVMGIGPRAVPIALADTQVAPVVDAVVGGPAGQPAPAPGALQAAKTLPMATSEIGAGALQQPQRPPASGHVQVREVQAAARSDEYDSPRAALALPPAHQVPHFPSSEFSSNEEPLEELPSLLGARPSFRASDPAPRRGPSWGMVLGVALLSSIIAAAGVVALQEVFQHRRHDVVALPVVPPPAEGIDTSRASANGLAPVDGAGAPAQGVTGTAAGAQPGRPAERAASPAPAGTTQPAADKTTPSKSHSRSARHARSSRERDTSARDTPAIDEQAGPAHESEAKSRSGRNRVLSGEFESPQGEAKPAGRSEPIPSNPYE